MRIFIDREREVRKEFEKIKNIKEPEKLKEALKKLINKDPYFLEPYILLSDIYEIEGNVKEAEKIIEEAYKKALELITEDGKLPDRLEWKYENNRHIIEALINAGIMFWEIGEIDRALEVFKNVYRMNPQDEVGVRYYILAILEGMSFEEFERVFSKEGEYDYKDLEEWFRTHKDKYKEFFII